MSFLFAVWIDASELRCKLLGSSKAAGIYEKKSLDFSFTAMELQIHTCEKKDSSRPLFSAQRTAIDTASYWSTEAMASHS
jgi:hypothetical protein